MRKPKMSKEDRKKLAAIGKLIKLAGEIEKLNAENTGPGTTEDAWLRTIAEMLKGASYWKCFEVKRK